MRLDSLALALARNSLLVQINNHNVVLKISTKYQNIATETAKAQLQQAIGNWCGMNLVLSLQFNKTEVQNTRAKIDKQKKEQDQQSFEDNIKADTHIQDLITRFDAKIDFNSIKEQI